MLIYNVNFFCTLKPAARTNRVAGLFYALFDYTCNTSCSYLHELYVLYFVFHSRRSTSPAEHALVHLNATLFIFGLIFKISAIIYTYTIEKTKKTMKIRIHNIKRKRGTLYLAENRKLLYMWPVLVLSIIRK